jgi:pyridoxal biosynthesis lyase PdxS
MSVSFKEIRALTRDFGELKKTIDHMRESVEQNTQEVAVVNKRAEEVKAKEKSEEVAWNEVPNITEEDRYPMVKTSEPGIKVQAQVLLKKLDII